MKFEERWRKAVSNLQLQTERLQATADCIPLNVEHQPDWLLSGDLSNPLYRHMVTLADYDAALRCLQGLLLEGHQTGDGPAHRPRVRRT
jgi:hypothetical protein